MGFTWVSKQSASSKLDLRASTVGIGLRRLQGWLAIQLTELKTATGLPIPTGVDPLTLIAGIVVIVMGLHFLGLTPIAMLARQKRFEVGKPVGLWGAYAMGGWLKPVHGVLMHGILVLPLLAWLMARRNWDERSQMRGVHTAIAVYALVVALSLMSAFNAA